MTLIDTPGLNDPQTKVRSDKQIFMNLVSTIRDTLKTPENGISMFVQCIMPDQSNRIRQTVIKAMMNFLLILSVFHRDTSVEDLKECHPRMAIVFNNVSKYDNEQLGKDLIQAYKKLLLDDATGFYCDQISDDTVVADK